MDPLISALATSGNLAVIALALVVVGLFALIRDRDKTLQESQKEMVLTLKELTETITQLRIQLAQGK